MREDGLLLGRGIVLRLLRNGLADHAHVQVGVDALALVGRQSQVRLPLDSILQLRPPLRLARSHRLLLILIVGLRRFAWTHLRVLLAIRHTVILRVLD